ncbi:MAG: exodeoxyribonuclease VII small subunit [Clostridia bacterium]|nr:exodeoxyribonuclease VII small subunit [Clostridia bacterium]
MKSFEESIKELEQTVQSLEKGDLTLEQALEAFEKGIALSKECNEKLDLAEKKINILVGTEGELKEESFVAEE